MNTEKVLLKNETCIKQVRYSDITHISICGDCSTFMLNDTSSFSLSKSLNEISKKLPDYFIRVNRNYIINSEHIQEFRYKSRKITLEGNITFTVSHRNLKLVKDTFKRHLF
ncbi:LytTR family transcriptional regulator DNA-binding domain-containing protein [Saccharicrinis fermentans]|uniref:LytTR family transcriptional regulator DNA-binding domain-containing protein n=1 Tax=Saccharicrinis fermentans TaxID=982 RepID=UPI0009E05529